MTTSSPQFPLISRILHWLMAVMIIAMLFIGVAMMSSLEHCHWLMSIHRPLGFAILILAVVRVINRLVNPPPELPESIGKQERLVAIVSEYLMYLLMIAMPLIGWCMLSAARYPIVLFGSIEVPYIFPHSLAWYAWLRQLHTIFAYVFAFLIFAHLTAILVHTLILRDHLIDRMALWRVKKIPSDSADSSSSVYQRARFTSRVFLLRRSRP